MEEGDNGRAAAEGEEVEVFRLPVSAEKVALGRLGCIYKALDRKTGRVLAVECIDVINEETELEEEGDYYPAEVMQKVLLAELERFGGIANGDKGRHVFCYNSVSCSRSRVYLRSSSSVIRNLAGLQKDFERLHPLAVKQYIYQVLHGLHALHELGIFCGGLSLSSLLLCGGNTVKIAAWFPPVQAVNSLRSQGVVADSQFGRSSFGLPLANDSMAQDVRSVAYVMLEMLTGLRVHGALMEKNNLLNEVVANSPEHRVLSSLLALLPLNKLLALPYFSSVNPAHGTVVHDSSPTIQEHVIGILTKQELNKCETMKRQYLQQIRTWQTQFEKKYHRKPKSADRPAGIVRLQGRCQALDERMKELNDRLAVAHGSIYRMMSATGALVIETSSQPIPDQSKDEDTGADSSDRGEGGRSPAQKAFLNRFASPQ